MPTSNLDDGPDAALALCHDITQLLILLCTRGQDRPAAKLHHNRWLNRNALYHLNQHLLHPESPRPQTHRRANRLRHLMFLAGAAGLHAAGSPDPFRRSVAP